MKKFFLLSLLLFAISLSSCSTVRSDTSSYVFQRNESSIIVGFNKGLEDEAREVAEILALLPNTLTACCNSILLSDDNSLSKDCPLGTIVIQKATCSLIRVELLRRLGEIYYDSHPKIKSLWGDETLGPLIGEDSIKDDFSYGVVLFLSNPDILRSNALRRYEFFQELFKDALTESVLFLIM